MKSNKQMLTQAVAGFSPYIQHLTYSKTSMARTGLESWKKILAKSSSSHPGWIMYKTACRDHGDSSS